MPIPLNSCFPSERFKFRIFAILLGFTIRFTIEKIILEGPRARVMDENLHYFFIFSVYNPQNPFAEYELLLSNKRFLQN